MIAATSLAARSAESLMTTASNSDAAAISFLAIASRLAIASALSVALPRSRSASSVMEGGAMKIITAPGTALRIAREP